jgi:hypothetical protein
MEVDKKKHRRKLVLTYLFGDNNNRRKYNLTEPKAKS